jgi:hypothetical protein
MGMFSTKPPFDLAEFLSQPASAQARSSLAGRRRNQAYRLKLAAATELDEKPAKSTE